MKLNVAILANRAWLDENTLLCIEGGGWEFIGAREFPWTVSGALAGLVEIGPDDLSQKPVLHLAIRTDGELAGSAGSIVIPPVRNLVPFVWPFSVVVIDEAMLTFEAADDAGDHLWSMSIGVRLQP